MPNFRKIGDGRPKNAEKGVSRHRMFQFRTVLFNLFVIAEPLKHFHVCHGTLINKKLKKHKLHVKKSKCFIIRHFNKQAAITEVKKQKI